MKKKIFVTGVTGYIGSHTAVELLNNNYEVIGLDNFSNSKADVLNSIYKITNKNIEFYEGDMNDSELLDKIFSENEIDLVIDFAAYKSVGDSVNNPLDYYQNNLSSVITLLIVMKKHNVNAFLFSSSATVYGTPSSLPYYEDHSTGDTANPYGTSKYFVEQVMKDLHVADDKFNGCILRYFNPVGSHSSGLIGEDPKGIPANLMPFICKVAIGALPELSIFGDDYNTVDGTGVRDYIHVVDLAVAHVKAVNKLLSSNGGLHIYNLGTGEGVSVLQMVKAFEKVNNVKVNYKIAPRREGDIDEYYANSDKAFNELGWKAEKTIEDMCRESYNFYKKDI
ncbi:MAG: UDP-glucose 4-epimerase GalE [bacterium]